MPDKREAVRLSDVFFAYPKNVAFSLDVPELAFASGECAALVGYNGSGKTTLGKLIAGIIRPSRGRVLLDGEDIADWPLGKIGGKIGYLFQEPSRQIFAPTVLEDITLPLTLKGMDEEQAQELARSMLVRFEMEPLENAITFTLSRGEKQRLAIISMLVNEPGFIVLDEPTTGLDARRKNILGDMLRQLVGEDVGILLISHDIAFVKLYASAVCRMNEGKVIAA